jgi:prophage regulatory protein
LDPFEIFERDESPLAATLRERIGPEPSLDESLSEILQPVRLLTFPELKSRKGISYTRQFVARLEARGEFPRRVQTGPNSIAWLEHEVDAWILSRPRGKLRDGRGDRGKAALERKRAEK